MNTRCVCGREFEKAGAEMLELALHHNAEVVTVELACSVCHREVILRWSEDEGLMTASSIKKR